MKKHTKKILCGVAAVGVIFLAGASIAKHHDGGWGHSGYSAWCDKHGGNGTSEMFGKMKKELGLTKEQMTILADLRAEHKKNMIQAKAELGTMKVDIMSELRKTDRDDTKIRALINELGQLKSQQVTQRLDGHLTMLNSLTPDQQEKAIELFGHNILSGDLHAGGGHWSHN